MLQDIPQPPETAKSLYKKLEDKRRPFLDRAREASALTIPNLIKPEGSTAHTRYATPYQSVGARGVNNISSKLLTTLFPPNAPFFRLLLDDDQAEIIAAQDESGEITSEIEESLAEIEHRVTQEIEKTGIRIKTFETLKHLVVAGNALLFYPPDGGVRVFHLDQYVVLRDPLDKIQILITLETASPLSLPENIRELIPQDAVDGETRMQEVVEIHTALQRISEDRFRMWQEVQGIMIPDSLKEIAEADIPYVAARFSLVSRESYGRGLVEEYMGDLQSLEGLSQSLVQMAAVAARIIGLVNPNGVTSVKKLNDAENGEWIPGHPEDLSLLQAEKLSDFRIVFETSSRVEERLGTAFLLNKSVTRQAERVTAEEIRFVAQELEDTLGGVYSIIGQDLQVPLVKRVLDQLQKQKKLPELPNKDVVEPVILTGLEVLGRHHDLNRLDVFVAGANQTLGPEAMSYIHTDEYMRRRAHAAGVDPDGLVKTPEELQAEQEAAQQAALIQGAAPGVAQELVRAGGAAQQQQG